MPDHNIEHYEAYPSKKLYAIVCVCWSAVILLSWGWNWRLGSEEIQEEMLVSADVYLQKVISFRQWAAEHGGVYVPVSQDTQPSPYLSFVPERDIETLSGRRLTLMNPSYMTRQLFEVEEDVLNVRQHLTSLNPIRPENAPDAWETSALQAFERGETEISEIVALDGEETVRVMRPLFVEEPCLACHAQQGYQEGDVRGGISISLPTAPFRSAEIPQAQALLFVHGLVWLLGMIGLGFGAGTIRGHVSLLNDSAVKLRESHDKIESALGNSIQALARVVEARDPYTAGHQQHVMELAVLMAEELGYSEEKVRLIRLGAPIHDIGKIGVPAELLSKPTKLTAAEFALIQTHPQSGFDIIKDVDFPIEVKNIILQHHERLDGSGYPQGLKGKAIEPLAMIVAVADIVEAISADRPYRPSKGLQAGLDEIQRQRGESLDGLVVDACLKVIAEKKWTV